MMFHFHFPETAKKMKTMKEEQRAMVVFICQSMISTVLPPFYTHPGETRSNLQTARSTLAVWC